MGIFCWIFFTLHNLVSFEFGLYLFGNISTLLCPAMGPRRLTSVDHITWMLLPFAFSLGSVSKAVSGRDQGKGVSPLLSLSLVLELPLPSSIDYSASWMILFYGSSSLRLPPHYFLSIGMASQCCLFNFLTMSRSFSVNNPFIKSFHLKHLRGNLFPTGILMDTSGNGRHTQKSKYYTSFHTRFERRDNQMEECKAASEKSGHRTRRCAWKKKLMSLSI